MYIKITGTGGGSSGSGIAKLLFYDDNNNLINLTKNNIIDTNATERITDASYLTLLTTDGNMPPYNFSNNIYYIIYIDSELSKVNSLSISSWANTSYNKTDYKIEYSMNNINYHEFSTINITTISTTVSTDISSIYEIYKTFILHNGKYKKYINSWSDYSTTLPTIEQFISDGMDDLSVFDRKPKTETIVMNDDINGGTGELLGSGKVFKKMIDLNKYFDLISLNVR